MIRWWRSFRGRVYLLLASIVWGASFVVTKDTLEFLTPLWQLALRMLVAAVPALFFGWRLRRLWNRKVLVQGILLGIIFFGALLPQNIGMSYTSASKSGFLTGTYVAFIPVISICMRKKVSKNQVVAAVVGMIGIACLTLNGAYILERGDLLLLLCGFGYAVHILYIDRCDGSHPLLVHVIQIITVAVLSTIVAVIWEPIPAMTQMPMRPVLGLLYCGIFEVFLGFFLQLMGQNETDPSQASIIVSMECLWSALFAILFLGESLGWQMILGGACIFGGTVIAARKPKNEVEIGRAHV